MSAIAGIFGARAAPRDEHALRSMLGGMAHRGSDRSSVWRDDGAALAVSRRDWELGPGFSGPVLVVQDSDCIIAADASLYYRADLRRKLAAKGVRPTGDTPSHLILAAYGAYGERCPQELEGDFAFVLYDRRIRRVLAARDFVGKRPLHWAELPGGGLAIASTIDGLLGVPGVPGEIDLAEVAVDAAGLFFSITDRTCRRGVRRLHAGHALSFVAEQRPRTMQWWSPPNPPSQHAESLDDAADELLARLSTAVSERLDPEAPTTVWLSGGWDSTAIYGAGQAALADEARDRLRAVSFSLPSSDPRCENAKIEDVARRWSAHVHWVRTDDVPLLRDPAGRAHSRQEPWAHEYEQLMRALVRGSRDSGTHIALDGFGGDFLFQVSPVILADLLRRARLVSLWREWGAFGRRDPRQLFRFGVQPLLADRMLDLARRVRGGRRLHGYMERLVPGWMHPDLVRTAALHERAAAGSPRATRGSRSDHEMSWLLTRPHFPRVVSATDEFALDDGLETRSPLLDGRVVALAASRPLSDRRLLGEKKRLLRHAMRGLLPESVLASRPFKTGSLRGYFTRAMRPVVPLLEEVARAPLLAELGVVDGDRFRAAVESYSRRPMDNARGVQLLSTMQAELWMRARAGVPAEPHDDRPRASELVAV